MQTRVHLITEAIRAILGHPCSRAEVAVLASVLAYYHTRALTKLMSYRRRARAPSVNGDRMLRASEAARMFGVSRSFLYERGAALGLTYRPPGARRVLFSEQALRRWASSQRE